MSCEIHKFMKTATLIIPISADVPVNIINQVIDIYRQQSFLDIVVSIHGHKQDKINSTVVERIYDGNFSLSKTRNAGAWVSNTDWLIFSDVDIVYQDDVFSNMIATGGEVVAGVTRRDISTDGVPGEYYKCTNSPMVITRKLFEEIGGYCELYSGWGYEDSHFEHKLDGKIIEFRSNADHLLNVHNLVSSSTGWGRGKDTNRQLFFDLQNKSLADRISDDRIAYFGAKAAYYGTKQSQD
jgi:predicted glycosyltransferase involved in capsule biosynthesis